MDKAEIILQMTLIPDHHASGVLQPRIQPLHLPTAAVTPQLTPILGLGLAPVGPMRRNDLDVLGCQARIQWVTVVGLVANQSGGRSRTNLGHESTVAPGFGEEFFGLREYVPGDPPRMVAWRPSAR